MMTTATTNNENETFTLLLVDVQKDFHPGGTLAIPTADEDAEKIAQFIKTHASSIDRIVVTMDSHHKLHIAHPQVWENENGEPPAPFTLIRHDDLKTGRWKVKDTIGLDKASVSEFPLETLQEYALEYTRLLEEKGRFMLCIWPEHCLIGTPGHSIVDVVRSAIDDWSVATGKSPEFIHKGMNNYTEMYSVMEAEVPVNKETSLNESLMDSLQNTQSDVLLVCGQAMSHCVNYTLRDIVKHWDETKKPLSSIYLLTDCASAVPSFEQAADEFQEDMRVAGVTLCTTNDL